MGSRADMVKLLLSRGADPDIQANTGVTPLHGAASNVAQSGSAAIVSLLLSYDADPNLRRSRSNPGLITRAGETGHSPLDDLVARGYGNYAEAARILRDAGGKCFVRTEFAVPECFRGNARSGDGGEHGRRYGCQHSCQLRLPVRSPSRLPARWLPRLKTQSPPQLRRAPARRGRWMRTA